MQGRDCDYRHEVRQAVAFFARATELDPGYLQAHALLAIDLCLRHMLDERPETLDEAAAHAEKALALDGNDAYAHEGMGWVALRRRQFDLAGQHFRRAVDLNPHDVTIAVDWAIWLVSVNRLDEALRCLDLAVQRDPFPPSWIWAVRGEALYFLKRYDEAIAAMGNLGTRYFWTPMILAAAFAQAGRSAAARRELESFLKAKPKATLGSVSRKLVWADESLRDHLLEGLRKAGLSA